MSAVQVVLPSVVVFAPEVSEHGTFATTRLQICGEEYTVKMRRSLYSKGRRGIVGEIYHDGEPVLTSWTERYTARDFAEYVAMAAGVIATAVATSHVKGGNNG